MFGHNLGHYQVLLLPLFTVYTDHRPQFCGDVPKFCSKYHIQHELSLPYNPKSNGLAKAAVKSVKNILRKSHASGADPTTMLYEWHNVPRSDGYSPAQLLFGRQQRTCLPIPPSQVQPINFSAATSSKDIAHDRSKSGNSGLVYQFPLLKFSQLTSLRLLHPRTSLMIVPNPIMTGQNIFFPCFLLANLCSCKIQRLES